MNNRKQDNKKSKCAPSTTDERLDLSLEKAVETLKQQANGYRHAGLTHISSLLD